MKILVYLEVLLSPFTEFSILNRSISQLVPLINYMSNEAEDYWRMNDRRHHLYVKETTLISKVSLSMDMSPKGWVAE